MKRHPADAVSFAELVSLIEASRRVDRSPLEEMALDIFVIAFCTMSRAGEIARLRVEDVLEEGDAIRILPKTEGATGNMVVKCVKGINRIDAENILKERRRKAESEGRTYIFTQSKKADSVVRTSTITNALTNLAEKCNIGRRITAHSARKGAAAEAILAGIPVEVVKAMGCWTQIDTLEKYIGDTVRRQVALLPFLAGGSR